MSAFFPRAVRVLRRRCAASSLLLVSLFAGASTGVAQTGTTSGWSLDCDTPGFGIGGRVFALGIWNNELVAGTYKIVNQDAVTLRHIGRYDGVRWRALGMGVNGPVRAVRDYQGDLYVGGEFTLSGTTPVTRIARWNGTAFEQVGQGFNGAVWDLVDHQGDLIAVGAFTHSGAVATGHVARWDGTTWLPLGTATYAGLSTPGVYCATSDGASLYVGGEFTAIDGVPASHVARYDGSWHDLNGGVNNFGYGYVWDLEMHLGRLYAAGAFDTAGGVPADDVAAWDGVSWSSLGPDLDNQTYGSDARCLTSLGTDLYVGGSFNRMGGATTVHRIVRYDGQTFWPTGGTIDAEVNPAGMIDMVTWNGRIWCGGEFQGMVQPGAAPTDKAACNHIVSFDGTTWRSLGRGDLGLEHESKSLGWWQGKRVIGGRMTYAGGSDAVAVALFDDGDWQDLGRFDGVVWGIVEHQGDLWVAGEFRKIDGLAVNGVARWDGTQWHALGNGPNLYGCYAIAEYLGEIYVGSLSNPLKWTGTAWQPVGAQIFGAITDLHVHNGLLYVGGSTPFTPGSPNLFVWNGSTLSVVGGGTDDAVEALGSYGGDLIVGGRFDHAGGVAVPGLARWNGSSFQPIGTGLSAGTVADIKVFQGDLVIGGDLHVPGGDYCVRWDGSSWQGMPGGSPNGFVANLLPDDARGELHLAGAFNAVGNIPASRYAIWHERLPWQDVGHELASARRAPFLGATSMFQAGQPLHFDVSSMQEGTVFLFAMGTQRIDLPLFGGTLVPNVDMGVFPALADGIGSAHFELPWPALPSGFEMHAQCWCLDASMPAGFTASNGLTLRQP